MGREALDEVFNRAVLKRLFPEERADQFFDALLGDPNEGAYDIGLEFKGHTPDKLWFEFHLRQRQGKCLACHLTLGLPGVFTRHPAIDLKGLVQEIGRLLDGRARCVGWQLGNTEEVSNRLHVIPLTISTEADR